MLIDISPLRTNVACRRLFASQFISGPGTMVSYVAVPWQLYELTRFDGQVGLLSLIQLVPVVLCGLLGGAIADRMDRKRLLIGSELTMAVCLAGLLLSMVAGPALAGLLLARWGVVGAYAFNLCTFLAAVSFIARIPRADIGSSKTTGERPHLLADLADGLRFAWARPELMGTYIVDIVAMAFAFPDALCVPGHHLEPLPFPTRCEGAWKRSR